MSRAEEVARRVFPHCWNGAFQAALEQMPAYGSPVAARAGVERTRQKRIREVESVLAAAAVAARDANEDARAWVAAAVEEASEAVSKRRRH